jgi:hypothetical protein
MIAGHFRRTFQFPNALHQTVQTLTRIPDLSIYTLLLIDFLALDNSSSSCSTAATTASSEVGAN